MKRNIHKLPKQFYSDSNTITIARKLIGKHLVTNINGKVCGGIIAETEAYHGVTDKASHAYGGRKTTRTEVMFREGGIAYVYFSYGMHHLFNVVTGKAGDPKAVLIRGIIPNRGIDTILRRRKQTQINPKLVNGPAKLCQALGISLEHNKISLLSNIVWIEDGREIEKKEIIITKRVGVDYAEADAALPYRFILRHTDYRTAK